MKLPLKTSNYYAIPLQTEFRPERGFLNSQLLTRIFHLQLIGCARCIFETSRHIWCKQ